VVGGPVKNIVQNVSSALNQNAGMKKKLEECSHHEALSLKSELKNAVQNINGINTLFKKVDIDNAGVLKDLAFQLKGEIKQPVFGAWAELEGKANIAVALSRRFGKSRKNYMLAILCANWLKKSMVVVAGNLSLQLPG